MNCTIANCERKAAARGLCSHCYGLARKLMKGGTMTWEQLEEKGLALPSKRKLNVNHFDAAVSLGLGLNTPTKDVVATTQEPVDEVQTNAPTVCAPHPGFCQPDDAHLRAPKGNTGFAPFPGETHPGASVSEQIDDSLAAMAEKVEKDAWGKPAQAATEENSEVGGTTPEVPPEITLKGTPLVYKETLEDPAGYVSGTEQAAAVAAAMDETVFTPPCGPGTTMELKVPGFTDEQALEATDDAAQDAPPQGQYETDIDYGIRLLRQKATGNAEAMRGVAPEDDETPAIRGVQQEPLCETKPEETVPPWLK